MVAPLLEGVAAEEAEQLYHNTLQCICRCPALICVQYRRAYIVAKNIGMVDPSLYGHIWGSERIVVLEFDGEMEWIIKLGCENKAGHANICIVEVQMRIRIRVLLEVCDIAQEPSLQCSGRLEALRDSHVETGRRKGEKSG